MIGKVQLGREKRKKVCAMQKTAVPLPAAAEGFDGCGKRFYNLRN